MVTSYHSKAMKNTQTQGQETGLASLLEGTTPGPWMVDPETPMNSLNEYRHEIRNVNEGWLVGYGWACSEQMALANARLIAAAPALAASNAALVAALDSIEASAVNLHCALQGTAGMDPNDKRIAAITGQVVRDLLAVRDQARKALSDARNLSAGMEGGRTEV